MMNMMNMKLWQSINHNDEYDSVPHLISIWLYHNHGNHDDDFERDIDKDDDPTVTGRELATGPVVTWERNWDKQIPSQNQTKHLPENDKPGPPLKDHLSKN